VTGDGVVSGRDGDIDRAVSTTVGYVLTLTLATMVVSGFLIASGGFVEDQREGAVRDELQVVGQQLATDIAAVDRLARTDGTATTVRIERDIPDRVAGLSYTVRTVSESPNELVLRTYDPDIIVRVSVATDATLVEGTFGGADVVVEYDAEEIEVTDA
jgi:hypothetical protein